MNVSLSSWFVLLLTVIAANLPFFNERLLSVIPLRRPVKSLWLRLAEMELLYVLVGGVAYMLEARIGNVFRQGWEFYAVTACLFLVFAFPGFVYRYLSKRRG